MADSLRNEPDLRVEVVNGSPGELTVLVDGEKVAAKHDTLPPINDVVRAVKQSGASAGARGR